MKWMLTLICVNSLISVVLYPLVVAGLGSDISWLLEFALLVAGLGSLYLLWRYRRTL